MVKTAQVTFANREGKSLAAKLELPETGEPAGYAVFAHCFTCGKDLVSAWNISQALAGRGIAVLRFDFTGLGESEGDFSATNFSHNVGDLVSAAGFLQNSYRAPSLLIGHSLGGAAAIVAAQKIASIRAVATIAAPYSLSGLAESLRGRLADIETAGEGMVRIGPREFTIRKQFLDDLESIDERQVVANLDKAILILHSPDDQLTPLHNALRLFKAARQPKSFIALPGADHLLSRKEDSRYAGELIACWAGKYLA